MRIGVLTSSRADYGIYRPLLLKMAGDPFFEVTVIGFGTHRSSQYGSSINQIIADGFEVKYFIHSMLQADDANAIATATALTSLKFADFWNEHGQAFDIVLCLGDRYEMFAAVSSGVPFGIRFAHLHGGETTLGAIDNVYRHSITLASQWHFTSASQHGERVKQILGHGDGVVVCGALSLDNLHNLKLLSTEAFRQKWNIDLTRPSVLITVHPETVHAELNVSYAEVFKSVLESLVHQYQLIFTLPNADTLGSVWRNLFETFAGAHRDQAYAIENFGVLNYFTCMKHVSFLLGNTSSGILEAASLGKRVINVGDRQKGRFAGDNVIHVPFSEEKILDAIRDVEKLGDFKGRNPYDAGGAAEVIINSLKKISV